MTVTNDAGQSAAQDGEKTLHRKAAGIYHGAGVRSDDEILRAVAATDPEAFAGLLDALEDPPQEGGTR